MSTVVIPCHQHNRRLQRMPVSFRFSHGMLGIFNRKCIQLWKISMCCSCLTRMPFGCQRLIPASPGMYVCSFPPHWSHPSGCSACTDLTPVGDHHVGSVSMCWQMLHFICSLDLETHRQRNLLSLCDFGSGAAMKSAGSPSCFPIVHLYCAHT